MKTLHELSQNILEELNAGKPLKELKELISKYEGNDWNKYKRLSKETYQRARIITNDQFEILLLGWNANQASPIHDHPKSGCILRMMEGELVEELYSSSDVTKCISSRLAKRNDVSYLEGDQIVHRISNKTKGPSFSLHIYSPPHYVPVKF